MPLDSIPFLLLTFSAAAAIIGVAGVRLATLAEVLSRRSRIGQATMGALFLGAMTSLSGITVSAAAAASGHGELALSNALGGIAIQTVFIVVADFAYRDANLEHAAASESVLIQSALLLVLLAMVLFACLAPPLVLGPVHFVSPLMVLAYSFGLRAIHGSEHHPMWEPRRGAAAHASIAEEPQGEGERLPVLWLRLAGAGLVCVASGWLLTEATTTLAARLQLSDTVAGGLLTGIATSLPELVIAVAAVRSGALTLAVAGVVGGNAFDTLFAALSDVFYVSGSIYETAGRDTLMLIALAMIMNGVLLLGLLRRQRSGLANIGFEGVIILSSYLGGMLLLTLA